MKVLLEGKEIEVPENTTVLALFKLTGTEVPPIAMLRHEYMRQAEPLHYGEPPRTIIDYIEEKRLSHMELPARVLQEGDQVEPFYWEDGGD